VIAGGRNMMTIRAAALGRQLVKTHPRKVRGKIAFQMRTPAACGQVIAGLLADDALYRLSAAQGVAGLADRHDPSRLEAACAKAIAAGDPSYKTIRASWPPVPSVTSCSRTPGTAAAGRNHVTHH
jgi:hypothetical protein